MKVRIKLTEEALGLSASNPKIHEEFITSKSADAAKQEEELAALPASELIEKSMTVFSRDDDGMPIFWDYQIKGFFKDVIGALTEISDKEVKIGKTKLSKFTYKRVVDNYLFVFPRKIRLAPVNGICSRPLRAETMRGDRVALSSSETVPAGTEFEFEVRVLHDALSDLVRQALDYGKLKGFGQWRNSGKGRFEWKEVQ